VEEAIKLGADGVSIHVNIGADDEKEMLKDFGEISKQCQAWGMPLLAMMYTRGKKIKKESDVAVVKHAARVAAELGADLVKVNYTGDVDSFRSVVEGCGVPVLIAGGEKAKSDIDVLKNIKNAILAGGGGVSIGRNVFQHEYPSRMIKAIKAIIHEDATVKAATAILEGR
jgi:DhnA family fructose-bisphosphate aldolase class Ia